MSLPSRSAPARASYTRARTASSRMRTSYTPARSASRSISARSTSSGHRSTATSGVVEHAIAAAAGVDRAGGPRCRTRGRLADGPNPCVHRRWRWERRCRMRLRAAAVPARARRSRRRDHRRRGFHTARRSRAVPRIRAPSSLERLGVCFVLGTRAVAVRSEGVVLASGALLPSDLVVWATGGAAPRLIADSGLPHDARGRLARGCEAARAFGRADLGRRRLRGRWRTPSRSILGARARSSSARSERTSVLHRRRRRAAARATAVPARHRRRTRHHALGPGHDAIAARRMAQAPSSTGASSRDSSE